MTAHLHDLPGLWSRSLIAMPDGARDVTTEVRWLQGRYFFADLRQPEGRPDFSGVTRLRDFNDLQLAWLARQEGFAGALEEENGVFLWRRDIDFQPPARFADAGRLWFEGDLLIEEGRDVAYIEHWRREDCAPEPWAGVQLTEGAGTRRALLIRVGAFFMFARSRSEGQLQGASLAACLAAAPSRAAAQDLLDCEISLGAVHDWRIERSSLPFKEGRALNFVRRGEFMDITDMDPDGAPLVARWHIVATEGQPDLLKASGIEAPVSLSVP